VTGSERKKSLGQEIDNFRMQGIAVHGRPKEFEEIFQAAEIRA
jgi:hypothetical protein